MVGDAENFVQAERGGFGTFYNGNAFSELDLIACVLLACGILAYDPLARAPVGDHLVGDYLFEYHLIGARYAISSIVKEEVPCTIISRAILPP